MRLVWFLLMLVVFFVGLALTAKNSNEVVVDLFFVQTPAAPLSLVILVTALAGAILGLLASMSSIFFLKARNRKLTRQHMLALKELQRRAETATPDVS